MINDLRQRSVAHDLSCISHQARSDATLNRRHFFRTAAGTSAAAVAAVASPIGAPEAQAYDPGPEESRGHYRESDHVEAFYRTNGYETLKK